MRHPQRCLLSHCTPAAATAAGRPQMHSTRKASVAYLVLPCGISLVHESVRPAAQAGGLCSSLCQASPCDSLPACKSTLQLGLPAKAQCHHHTRITRLQTSYMFMLHVSATQLCRAVAEIRGWKTVHGQHKQLLLVMGLLLGITM